MSLKYFELKWHNYRDIDIRLWLIFTIQKKLHSTRNYRVNHIKAFTIIKVSCIDFSYEVVFHLIVIIINELYSPLKENLSCALQQNGNDNYDL